MAVYICLRLSECMNPFLYNMASTKMRRQSYNNDKRIPRFRKFLKNEIFFSNKVVVVAKLRASVRALGRLFYCLCRYEWKAWKRQESCSENNRTERSITNCTTTGTASLLIRGSPTINL